MSVAAGAASELADGSDSKHGCYRGSGQLNDPKMKIEIMVVAAR